MSLVLNNILYITNAKDKSCYNALLLQVDVTYLIAKCVPYGTAKTKLIIFTIISENISPTFRCGRISMNPLVQVLTEAYFFRKSIIVIISPLHEN